MNVNITIRFKAIFKNEFFTEFSQAIRMWNSIYGYNGILSRGDYFKGQWWLVYILIKWCLMIFSYNIHRTLLPHYVYLKPLKYRVLCKIFKSI